MDIRGAKVLLTGASGGIGHAIAAALAQRGAQLSVTGRRTDVLDSLAADVGATALAADLSTAAAIDELLDSVGDVDILVANAALPASGKMTTFSVPEVNRALAVNLRAPILMARALGERMAQRGGGHIVFIGSVAGRVASPGGSLYSATKFGLRGFSLGLRQDMDGTGVGVSIVEPGFVRDAGMFAESGTELPKGVRSVGPDDVAKGVIRAIERNLGEVVVAPVEVKVGSTIGLVAPTVLARAQSWGGAAEVAARLAEGQRNKR